MYSFKRHACLLSDGLKPHTVTGLKAQGQALLEISPLEWESPSWVS